MRTRLQPAIFLLGFIFCMQAAEIPAQSCNPDSLAVAWTFTIDKQGLDDIAWDIEPIDNDYDNIKDDGFVVAGSAAFSGPPNRQAYIILLDQNGDTVWTRTYGDNNDDVAYAVEQASNGNIVSAALRMTPCMGTSAIMFSSWKLI